MLEEKLLFFLQNSGKCELFSFIPIINLSNLKQNKRKTKSRGPYVFNDLLIVCLQDESF